MSHIYTPNLCFRSNLKCGFKKNAFIQDDFTHKSGVGKKLLYNKNFYLRLGPSLKGYTFDLFGLLGHLGLSATYLLDTGHPSKPGFLLSVKWISKEYQKTHVFWFCTLGRTVGGKYVALISTSNRTTQVPNRTVHVI